MSKAQSEKKNSIDKDISQDVVTRFAPSPTGVLHIGGARTALFNYLFARQNNGRFILRLEDTDKERSKKECEEDIIRSLKWLGLDWDKSYKQSERKEIYKKYINHLIKKRRAYISKEVTGNRATVIRFKNPCTKISFQDLIRGQIEFDTTELGDFVIAKDENTPLFHLTGAIDDYEMKISHIIRGEDHISNTPRQILIQQALDFSSPIYSHIPLILGPDRSKLSKRHGAVSLKEYKDIGYLSEALINFLAFLGWNPGTEKEIFSLEELIKEFSLKQVQKSGAIFNIEKLNWINKQYIMKKNLEELAVELIYFLPEKWREKAENEKKFWRKIAGLERERISTLSEIGESINYFFEEPNYEKEKLLWKNEKSLNNVEVYLKKIIEMLSKLSEKEFTSHNIKELIWDYAEKQGRGNVLWPLRVSLTGLEKSPEPFIISEILGQTETIRRIQNAINKL
ncbi:MAG: glutamate--tRNA ligase [Patescibacteria group bacterium]